MTTTAKRDVIMVMNAFKEPTNIDDDNAWDAGKARARYIHADDVDALLDAARAEAFAGAAKICESLRPGPALIIDVVLRDTAALIRSATERGTK